MNETLETCGIVKIDGIIELPDYMVGNIDPETLCVQLTPIGVYQELFVDRIEYGAKVVIRNGSGGSINAYYHVHAKAKVVISITADDHEQYRTTDI
tara:strand:+ start:259 stop:546 length:288 start_codon:yes stop_codon:yes gene_type:complete